jgi:hypothetical protein
MCSLIVQLPASVTCVAAAKGRPSGLHGARWAAGVLKRYRDETVFLSPSPIVQRALIARLARDA